MLNKILTPTIKTYIDSCSYLLILITADDEQNIKLIKN